MKDTSPDITPTKYYDHHNAIGRPSLKLDVALYDKFLEISNLTDDEKQAYLNEMWAVIVGFIDLGFSVQPYEKTCGQGTLAEQATSDPDSEVLELIKHTLLEFEETEERP